MASSSDVTNSLVESLVVDNIVEDTETSVYENQIKQTIEQEKTEQKESAQWTHIEIQRLKNEGDLIMKKANREFMQIQNEILKLQQSVSTNIDTTTISASSLEITQETVMEKKSVRENKKSPVCDLNIDEQNLFDAFVNECCQPFVKEGTESAKMFDVYDKFCITKGKPLLSVSKPIFNSVMDARFGRRHRGVSSEVLKQKKRCWFYIGLKSEMV
jgi:hypothetical protein